MGETKPVIIAFRQEMDVMARVVRTVRSTLKNLKLAMEGTIVMSDDLANALDSMFNAKVPALWLKGNWFSPTVGMWFGISKSLRPPFPSGCAAELKHVYYACSCCRFRKS